LAHGVQNFDEDEERARAAELCAVVNGKSA
jgi:hypothetical protein